MSIEKKNCELLELGDGIIATMGALLKSLDFGKKGNRIIIPIGNDELAIEVQREQLPIDSIERLSLWVELGMKIEMQYNIEYSKIMMILLRFDGWSWNAHVLRSAPERSDYIEMPIDEARKIYGMKWLENYS